MIIGPGALRMILRTTMIAIEGSMIAIEGSTIGIAISIASVEGAFLSPAIGVITEGRLEWWIICSKCLWRRRRQEWCLRLNRKDLKWLSDIRRNNLLVTSHGQFFSK